MILQIEQEGGLYLVAGGERWVADMGEVMLIGGWRGWTLCSPAGAAGSE